MDQPADDVDTFNMTGAEVGVELVRACHEKDLLDLRIARLAARFAATDEYDEQGFVSPIDWVRFNCHLTSGTAANLVAVGEATDRMPESIQALNDGAIGFAHLTTMTRTANAVGASFDESALLAKALENSPGKFHYICHHYRHAADRQGYEAEQAELVQNRRLSISTWEDGSVLLSGLLDPVGGATLRTALGPLARKSGAHDDRSPERRNADALVDLSMHALDSGLIPQQASQRTHRRSRHRSRPSLVWLVPQRRRWSSRFRFPPRRSSGWPATARSLASCSARIPWSSTSAARSE